MEADGERNEIYKDRFGRWLVVVVDGREMK